MAPFTHGIASRVHALELHAATKSAEYAEVITALCVSGLALLLIVCGCVARGVRASPKRRAKQQRTKAAAAAAAAPPPDVERAPLLPRDLLLGHFLEVLRGEGVQVLALKADAAPPLGAVRLRLVPQTLGGESLTWRPAAEASDAAADARAARGQEDAASVRGALAGKKSAGFLVPGEAARSHAGVDDAQALSVVFAGGETLDLVADSKLERDALVQGFIIMASSGPPGAPV